jgi:hypothetical protein
MTSDIDWDPSSYDNIIDNIDPFYNPHKDEVCDSPFNVHKNSCHSIATTTDTVFSDTPAADSGLKDIQIFIGNIFYSSAIYSLKTEKLFVNNPRNNICEWGAMDILVCCCACTKTNTQPSDIRYWNLK